MYVSSQSDKIEQIDFPLTFTDAVSARAKLQYIATATIPRLSGVTQLRTAPVMHGKTTMFDRHALCRLKKLIKYVKISKNEGLKVVEFGRVK